MKKIMILLPFVIALTMMSFTMAPNMEIKNADKIVDCLERTSITVTRVTPITGSAGSVCSFTDVSAEIDWSTKTLYVYEGRYEMQYTVHDNPYYGYDDDCRGNYRYCASNYYWK